MRSLVGRGGVMYTLSIVTKFHTGPHYPLDGSELSRWVHTLGSSLRFGLPPSIRTKA